jgi:hypothetical protein
MNSITVIFNHIKTLKVSSAKMKDYINSLDKEDYASLSTIYIIGRDNGWERNYEEHKEYDSFIEENEAQGIKVTQAMLDNKFLTKEIKQKQVSVTYNYELTQSPKIDGVYNHDWLGMKTNLITAVTEGLKMMQEIN